MPVISVNGAELYHEVRGEGAAVLLVMGASGDAGHFERLAQLLADEFTVVTYDRRGNGRSPRPAGWTTTSPEEQADDAAALLDALGLAPAAVFGTSSGANFALAHQAARRLAERLGVELTRTPGGHAPYQGHPDELARTMRAFLHEISETAA
jgi:pimeloyl-ACP methyl ester carboxylesterase